jgi:chloramphenicol-sensitive protein RarD
VAEVETLAGLFIETALLAPLALAWLAAAAASGEGAFGAGGRATDGLLAFSGVATLLPLVLFVGGARRIRLSTLGLLQYVVPTMHFALAVFAFGEPFGRERLVAFACIWLALAVYSIDLVGQGRRA